MQGMAQLLTVSSWHNDPTEITPDNLRPLVNGSNPAYGGTIADHFEGGLTDQNIDRAPSDIESL